MNDQIITLKEYIDGRVESLKEKITAALVAAEKAVIKAETASDKRFEAVNEFRNTLQDQQRTLIPRMEAEVLFKGISDRLKVLEDARIDEHGKGYGMKNLWALIIGIVGFISIILSIVFNFLR